MVFLVSRMQEEWLKLRDNSAAVNRGQAITGRIITAAAAIMIVVFSSFVVTTDRTVKMIGLGMAVAVLIDALLIRTVLVPAIMHIIGKANWSLPAALGRRLRAWNSKPVRKRSRRRPGHPPTRRRSGSRWRPVGPS